MTRQEPFPYYTMVHDLLWDIPPMFVLKTEMRPDLFRTMHISANCMDAPWICWGFNMPLRVQDIVDGDYWQRVEFFRMKLWWHYWEKHEPLI